MLPKRIISFISLIAICCVNAFAQEADPALMASYRENVFRTGGNMAPYEYLPGVQTAAPKGYKPFYISHYGRHGARTNWDGKHEYQALLNLYEKAHEAGILTPEGEAAREQIATIIKLHAGNNGRLTELGIREHRQIAQRMYRNYPEVFRKGSKKISAVSSTTPRCIISMNASTGQLLSMQSDLDIIWDAGEATIQPYVSSSHTSEMRKSIKAIRQQYWESHSLDTSSFADKVFTNPKAARETVGSMKKFMRNTFNLACASAAFELDDRLFRLFTDEDLYTCAQEISIELYLGQCASEEFASIRLPLAKPLIDSIVTQADAAIAKGEYCAHLRYGHDYQVLAGGAILGFEGLADVMNYPECQNWPCWYYSPFATNIQLIFYRNKAGDVLVKPLLNEREVKVKGLRGGPYYSWEDYKTYLGYGPKTSVHFTEGAAIDKRTSTFCLDIANPPAGTDWFIWFNQFRTPTTMLEGSQGTIEHVSGTLYRIIPTVDTATDPLHLKYQARTLVNRGRAAEGFVLERKGFPARRIEASYSFIPQQPKHSFEWEKVNVGITDMIPALKSVTPINSPATVLPEAFTSVTMVPSQKSGWYRITIKDSKASLEAADSDAEYWAGITYGEIVSRAAGSKVQSMVIEDWPDLQHRGFMLDVSRNFTTKDNVLKLLDLMAHYKANVLHLHFGDDEGWRVEIEPLKELTQYGAFRGLPQVDENGKITEPYALQPTYCTTMDRYDKSTSANGYYSRQDFIEILRYATARHIRVIPEFDTPGHSRAAIKSMEQRALRTGDASFLLSEPADTSRYVSVQDYTDNAVNVALESTYKFVETVFDALIAMYREADAPLEIIHVGGDEVPNGAWTGSPACAKLMQEKGWKDLSRLKDYYVSRVLDIAISRGVKIGGWQELVVNLEPETLAKLPAGLGLINVWTVSRGREEVVYQLANRGIPVIVSSAPNAYMDLAYNDSKLERGHSWAGFLDERRSFSLLPYSMYRSVRWDDHGRIKDISKAPDGKTPLTRPESIIGVQGQLWTETIRNFDHVTYYVFPKSLGLFERGWNASPAWEGTVRSDDPLFMEDFNRFYSIIQTWEFPYYESMGISYHKN